MSGDPKSIGAKITEQAARLGDRALLEGAMATAALVAMADEHLDIEETPMAQTMVLNAKALEIHDLELATNVFARYVESLRRDREAGREEAFKAIAVCREDVEAIEVILRVGIAIAKADHELARSEIDMINEICAWLEMTGLDLPDLIGIRPRPVH